MGFFAAAGEVTRGRGVSLYKISELMGNSAEICKRHYAAIATEGLVRDVDFGRTTPRVDGRTA